MTQQNGSSGNDFLVKAGLAQMLKGGVIMDVVNAEQVGFITFPPSPIANCQLSIASNSLTNMSLYRLALLKKPVLPLSWLSSVSPLISVSRVALRACPTLA